MIDAAMKYRTVGRMPNYLLLKISVIVCVCVAILIHPGSAGLGGRPTLFHIAVLGVIFSFFISIVGNGNAKFSYTNIDLLFGRVAIIIMFSYLFNIEYASEVDQRLQYGGGTGAMWKVMVYGISTLVFYYCGFRAGKSISRSAKDVSSILYAIVFATTVNAGANVLAWFQETGGVLVRYGFIPPFTFSPGISASLSTIGFILALPLASQAKRSIVTSIAIYCAMIVLSFSILILTVRQYYVVFGGVLLIYTFLVTRNQKVSKIKRLIFIAVSALFICGMAFFIITQAGDSLVSVIAQTFDKDGEDVSGRAITFFAAWELANDNPIFGVGYGLFGGRNDIPMFVKVGEDIFVSSAHNAIAQMASEIGYVGLIVFLWMGYSIFNTIWNISKSLKNHQYCYNVSCAIASLILFELISQLISNSNLLPPVAEAGPVQQAFIYWLLIGIALALPQIDEREEKQKLAL